MDLRIRCGLVLFDIVKKVDINTDCSPQHGPDGLHVLSCGPTSVDNATEQDDEHSDPDTPSQDIARPGKQFTRRPR